MSEMKRFQISTHNGDEFVVKAINDYAAKCEAFEQLADKYPNHERWALIRLGDSLEAKEVE